MDEAQIISGLRACSAAAHEALYDQYAGDLYDYCHALLGDDAAAVGALRETLLRAAASTDAMPAGCGLRPWLYALARGQCRSAGEPLIEHPMPDDDPSARLLVSVLGTLTARDREVLELTGRHGLSEDDLEPVLGLPADRVESLVSDARRRFDQAMAEELDRTGPVEYPALAEIADDDGTDPLPLLFRALPRVAPPSGQRPRILDDLLIAGTTGSVPAAFAADLADTPPHGVPAVAGEPDDGAADAAASPAHGRAPAKRRRGLLVSGAVAAVVVVAGVVFAVTQMSGSQAGQNHVAAGPARSTSVEPTNLPSQHSTRKAGDVKYHGHHRHSASPSPSRTTGTPDPTGAHHAKKRGSTPSTSPTSGGGHTATSRPTRRPGGHTPTHRPTHQPTPTHSATPTPTITPTTTAGSGSPTPGA